MLSRTYISLIIGPRASKCDNNLSEIMAVNILQASNLIFDPFLKVDLGHILKGIYSDRYY